MYDALVSISVPSDKARAVVDAMEQDMGTTLATKQDLAFHATATKQDLAVHAAAMKQELAVLASAMKQELAVLASAMKQETELLRRDMENRFAFLDQKIDVLRSDVTRDLAALELRMTAKLGSMLVVGFGLTIAALRLWG